MTGPSSIGFAGTVMPEQYTVTLTYEEYISTRCALSAHIDKCIEQAGQAADSVAFREANNDTLGALQSQRNVDYWQDACRKSQAAYNALGRWISEADQ